MNLCSIYKQIKYVCLVCAHAYNTEKVKSFLSFQFSISVFVVHFFMFFFLHAGAIHITCKQHYVVCICHVCMYVMYVQFLIKIGSSCINDD